MLQFDLRLQQHVPQWFRGGRGARIIKPLLRGFGHRSRSGLQRIGPKRQRCMRIVAATA